jgi:hypothetical protein
MSTEQNDLLKILNTGIVWIQQPGITHGAKVDTRFPFTRIDIPEIDFKYDTNKLIEDEQSVTCYDIIHGEYVTLKYNQHENYHRMIEYERGVNILMEQINDVNYARECVPGVDLNIIRNVRFGYNLKTESRFIWDSYIKMQFRSQNISEIFDEIDETVMQQWRDWFMDQIRLKRQESFLELDQLEQEAKDNDATAEDLEDIDTIKQMFRDIPQQTNLEQYKHIEEMLNFWPSLILPSPFMVNFTELKSMVIESDPRDEIITLLNSIDELDELIILVDDLKKLGAEDAEKLPPYVVEEIESRIQKLRE